MWLEQSKTNGAPKERAPLAILHQPAYLHHREAVTAGAFPSVECGCSRAKVFLAETQAFGFLLPALAKEHPSLLKRIAQELRDLGAPKIAGRALALVTFTDLECGSLLDSFFKDPSARLGIAEVCSARVGQYGDSQLFQTVVCRLHNDEHESVALQAAHSFSHRDVRGQIASWVLDAVTPDSPHFDRVVALLFELTKDTNVILPPHIVREIVDGLFGMKDTSTRSIHRAGVLNLIMRAYEYYEEESSRRTLVDCLDDLVIRGIDVDGATRHV